MGFNCPKDDASFLFDFEALGIDCGKYDTSDCSDEDDEDLNIIAVEETESVIEDAVVVDESDDDKYKDSGKCGTQSDGRKKHKDECVCINRNCCSGENKCKSHESFCNKMGFNCPEDDDSFLFDFEALGIDCGKYDTSDCSDDEDLNIIAVEEIEPVIENAVVVDESDFHKYKSSGKCGSQSDGRAKHEDECVCINQNCCSGDAKCNSNLKFCNKMGFNCPKDEDASFLFDFEALGIDCGKYDTSDCSDEDDEDLFITQVE
jgi:hypothetical protein